MNDIKPDSRGNHYLDVNTIRLTYIAADNRSPSKDWSKQNVIRIQAYRNGKAGSLHRGAELPVGNLADVLGLVEAICRLGSLVG